MNKSLVVILLAAFTFFGNAHAAREKVAACPKSPEGMVTIEGQNWIMRGMPYFDFLNAVVALTENDLIYCVYKGNIFARLLMPEGYDRSSCSFVRNSIEVVTTCKNVNPQACVIYCEKK